MAHTSIINGYPYSYSTIKIHGQTKLTLASALKVQITETLWKFEIAPRRREQ